MVHRRGHQYQRAVSARHRTGAIRHGQGLESRQGLGGTGISAPGVLTHQTADLAGQSWLGLQGRRPAPLQADGIEQGFGTIAAEQHHGDHPEGVKIHPGLGGPARQLLGRGIAGGGPAGICRLSQTPQQTEIQQHRLAITIAAQQIGGGEIPMDQLLAMQHYQYGQELTQQQQHLASTEDQLTVAAGSQQLAVGAAPLPFAHQPKGALGLNRRPKAGYLGMEHPLQTGP